MDSFDFYKVVSPQPSRESTDAMLTCVLLWVGKWAIPDRVFSQGQLEAWALAHGFEKVDNKDLVHLIREAKGWVPAPSPLNTAMNDALTARGG